MSKFLRTSLTGDGSELRINVQTLPHLLVNLRTVRCPLPDCNREIQSMTLIGWPEEDSFNPGDIQGPIKARPSGSRHIRVTCINGHKLFDFAIPVNDATFVHIPDEQLPVALNWDDPFFKAVAAREAQREQDPPMEVKTPDDEFVCEQQRRELAAPFGAQTERFVCERCDLQALKPIWCPLQAHDTPGDDSGSGQTEGKLPSTGDSLWVGFLKAMGWRK